MPTLSIIQAENKYAVSYLGEEHEICRMLTQCALRDELLAGAILRSASLLSQKQDAPGAETITGSNPEISRP
jgi:hypothetical protein